MLPKEGRGELVVIIGGGVIGLTTAQFLLEAGYRVEIYARDLPGDLSVDYSSPWAGAIWGPDFDEPSEMQGWFTQSYEYFHEMWKKRPEEATQAGVVFRKSRGWMSTSPFPADKIPKASEVWYSALVGDFEFLSPSSLPAGMVFGRSYTTFCINSPTYLSYLNSKILGLGGIITRHNISISDSGEATLASALKDLGGGRDVLAYVNATGLDARSLVSDEKIFPTRGQTVYVRGEAEQITTRLDTSTQELAHAVPRVGSGYTLLGGTMEKGDWEAHPKDEVTARILRQCKAITPELLDSNGEFEVLQINVGRRPSRKGGARVEVEELKEGVNVVHCYGHGGGGFEKSIGSANKVLKLVNEIHAK